METRLKIIAELEPTRYKSGSKKRVRCICECGNTIDLFYQHYISQHTKSCGCLNNEKRILNGKSNLKHGHSNKGGYVKSSPEYFSWSAMKTRCNNPKNKDWNNYGGRGIIVCDRWVSSFENFLKDMGNRPEGFTLDRIDPNGNYEPINCRWADDETQRKNKRVMNKKNKKDISI